MVPRLSRNSAFIGSGMCGSAGTWVIPEPEAVGRPRRPEAVVLQVAGVGLCEALRLGGDGDRGIPEVLAPVVVGDPLVAVLRLPHVGDRFPGLVLRLADENVHSDALHFIAALGSLEL